MRQGSDFGVAMLESIEKMIGSGNYSIDTKLGARFQTVNETFAQKVTCGELKLAQDTTVAQAVYMAVCTDLSYRRDA